MLVRWTKKFLAFNILIHDPSDTLHTACGTALYSTTTSETFTAFVCVKDTTISGLLTMCEHDDCGSAGTETFRTTTDATAWITASTTGTTATAQPSSSVALGPIIGGSLGGLGIVAVVVVALVWLLYGKREGGRSHKSHPVDASDDHRHTGGNVPQSEGIHPKPNLSASSPAIVPNLISSPPCQQEPNSGRANDLIIRQELPTE